MAANADPSVVLSFFTNWVLVRAGGGIRGSLRPGRSCPCEQCLHIDPSVVLSFFTNWVSHFSRWVLNAAGFCAVRVLNAVGFLKHLFVAVNAAGASRDNLPRPATEDAMSQEWPECRG